MPFLLFLNDLLNISALEIKKDGRAFQYKAMMCLTGAHEQAHPFEYLQGVRLVDSPNLRWNVCQWNDVLCVDGILEHIRWAQRFEPIQWNLSWFPTHVKSIICTSVAMGTVLKTRTLPRYLGILCMNTCYLHGTLEMQTLPNRLIRVSLQGNDFDGILWLNDLPPRLQEMNVRANRIEKVYCSVEDLPKELTLKVITQKNWKKVSVEWIGEMGNQKTDFIS